MGRGGVTMGVGMTCEVASHLYMSCLAAITRVVSVIRPKVCSENVQRDGMFTKGSLYMVMCHVGH